MRFLDVVKYSGRSLRVQRGRAILTILGVVIGITAIVALNGLTGGFSNLLTGQLSNGLSVQTLTVTSGGGELAGLGGASGAPAALYLDNITGLESIPHVDIVLGAIAQPVSFSSNITGKPKEYAVRAMGVDFTRYAELYSTFSSTTPGGIGAIPADNKSIVIGNSLYHPYSANSSVMIPLDQNLSLSWQLANGSTTRYSANVTAVLGTIGFSLSGGPTDQGIYIPIGIASSIFDTKMLAEIVVHVDTSDQVVINETSAAIKAYFAPAGVVSVTVGLAMLSTFNSILGTVSALLTAIAAISLIVAGIGILNIMTLSILERTREIGILKAIGATDRSVLGIFLVEALLVGLIGSLVGIGFGYIGADGLGILLFGSVGSMFGRGLPGFVPVIGPALIGEAIFFGILVAIVFALYPAIKASKKPPVEALRFE